MKLYLVRHPQPDISPGTCYGRMDVPLRTGWQSEAQALKHWLNLHLSGKADFWHSPLQRTAQLANYLSAHSKGDRALMELDFGLWEGRLWQDIPRSEIECWNDDLVCAAPYQGESLQQMAERLSVWWHSRKEESSDSDNLVVITHSGVIKVLVALLCQWPLAQAHIIRPAFTSITELTVTDRFVSLDRMGSGDWVN